MKIHTKGLSLGNSRGAVAALVAVMFTVFVGIAALAIDIGYLSTTRNELQNLADAAALAGAGYLGSIYAGLPPAQQGTNVFLRQNIVDVIQDAAQTNRAGGASVLIETTNNDIVIGLWNPTTRVVAPTLTGPDAVYVKARRDEQNSPISTFFAGIFGIDTMSTAAEAVAALTGPLTVITGELITPFGLSERAFPNDCKEVIAFNPTPSSCAGWHNFFDPSDADAMQSKMYGLINSDTCGHCDTNTKTSMVDGSVWLTNNFNVNLKSDSKKITVPTPSTSVGDKFNFNGGNLATLFQGDYLGSAYDGNTHNGTLYSSNGKVTLPKDAKSPAPMIALFDYFRYRDGDDDLYDDGGNLIAYKNDIWSATIPVYKDKSNVDCKDTGTNPNTAIEIVGFARIIVFRPNPPPSTNLDVKVDCDLIVVEGRGGGGPFGPLRGNIPNLVQ